MPEKSETYAMARYRNDERFAVVAMTHYLILYVYTCTGWAICTVGRVRFGRFLSGAANHGSSSHLRSEVIPGRFEKLNDLRDSLIQVHLDTDVFPLGNLLRLQDVGIGHRQRQSVSFSCVERNRSLSLIDVDDGTAVESGCGLAD